MPFTPAHVAAVLPLRRVRGVGLPLAALAAGSMSPDLPYYVPALTLLNPWTHTLPGVVTVDLLLGLVMWAAWRSVNPALHDLSPGPVRERWRPAGWRSHPWWAVVISVAIGATTHVAWDAFTHRGRFGATHLGFLAASYPGPLGPVPGYQYAQYFSGVVGLAILGWVALRQTRTPSPSPVAARLRLLLAALCATAFAVGAVARVSATGVIDSGFNAVAFVIATGGLGASGATLLVTCWAYALRRHRAGGVTLGDPGSSPG